MVSSSLQVFKSSKVVIKQLALLQSSAQAQRYTASALKTTQTYINTGKAQQKAQEVATETFLKPTKKVFKRTRNWTIGLGLAAVGIYGFTHGMGTALVGLTKNVSE